MQVHGLNVLADLGCGSGLSSAAARQAAGPGVRLLGSDASPAMLALATAPAGGCAGSVLLSDFGQGLPFRSGCLDGVISISAVQARRAPCWLAHRWLALAAGLRCTPHTFIVWAF